MDQETFIEQSIHILPPAGPSLGSERDYGGLSAKCSLKRGRIEENGERQ